NENPEGIEANDTEPLGTRLFKSRLQLVRHFSGPANGHVGSVELRGELVAHLQREVAAMPTDNFLVRMKVEAVERFQQPERWKNPTDEDFDVFITEVAGLPTTLPSEKLETKMFDLRCLRMQLALVENN